MMTRILLMRQDNLITLSKKPKLLKVFVRLLELTDATFHMYPIKSYQHLAKVLGFKTKSGAWKAINKLVTMGLISIEHGFVKVPIRGYFDDMGL